MRSMKESSSYSPPAIWTWDKGKENGGRFAEINRPIAGATHDRDLPLGVDDFQVARDVRGGGCHRWLRLKKIAILPQPWEVTA